LTWPEDAAFVEPAVDDEVRAAKTGIRGTVGGLGGTYTTLSGSVSFAGAFEVMVEGGTKLETSARSKERDKSRRIRFANVLVSEG